MLSCPFPNKRYGMTRKRTAQHVQIPQVKDGLMLSIQSMEMRGIVIPPEHLNHNTIEDADRRHVQDLEHCLLASHDTALIYNPFYRVSIRSCYSSTTAVPFALTISMLLLAPMVS